MVQKSIFIQSNVLSKKQSTATRAVVGKYHGSFPSFYAEDALFHIAFCRPNVSQFSVIVLFCTPTLMYSLISLIHTPLTPAPEKIPLAGNL